MKNKTILVLCIITLILVVNGCSTKNEPDSGDKENITNPAETQGVNIDNETKAALSTTPEATRLETNLDDKAS